MTNNARYYAWHGRGRSGVRRIAAVRNLTSAVRQVSRSPRNDPVTFRQTQGFALGAAQTVWG